MPDEISDPGDGVGPAPAVETSPDRPQLKIERITRDDLRRFASALDATAAKPDGSAARAYTAALHVLKEWLGRAWVHKEVFNARSARFLRVPHEQPVDGFLYYDRVISLADMLFKLQEVEGIEHKVARLRNSDFESGLAELEGAFLVHSSGWTIRFIEESKQLGADYDFDALLDDELVGCEAKCKIETTALSEGSVVNALKKACEQLPRDRAGIVLMKVPESWAANAENEVPLTNAINNRFRASGRLSCVLLHWERWLLPIPPKSGPAFRLVLHRTFHNPGARRPLTRFGNILHTRPEYRETFMDIVGDQSNFPIAVAGVLQFSSDYNKLAKRRGVTRALAEDVISAPDLVHQFGERAGADDNVLWVYVRRSAGETNDNPYGVIITGGQNAKGHYVNNGWRLYHADIDVLSFATARDALRAFVETYGMTLRIGPLEGRYLEAQTVFARPTGEIPMITVVGGSKTTHEVIALASTHNAPRRCEIVVACGVNDDAYSAGVARRGFIGR